MSDLFFSSELLVKIFELLVRIFSYSRSTILICANLVLYERTKHTHVYAHFVRNKVVYRAVKVVNIYLINKVVDFLNK